MATQQSGRATYDTSYNLKYAGDQGKGRLRRQTRGALETYFRKMAPDQGYQVMGTAADRMRIFLESPPDYSMAEAGQGADKISAQKIFRKYLQAKGN